MGIVELTRSSRTWACRDPARYSRRPRVRSRPDDGRSHREIAAWPFCSHDLIAGVMRRFRVGGVDAVLPRVRTDDDEPVPRWLFLVAHWVTLTTPSDHG